MADSLAPGFGPGLFRAEFRVVRSIGLPGLGHSVAAELVPACSEPDHVLTTDETAERRTDRGQVTLVDEDSHPLGRQLEFPGGNTYGEHFCKIVVHREPVCL
jgi:hypothetical protein